jgi:TetR/AcrR family transcriptional regulator, regulator of cefoperazone and chloramphenicol sensitivity
MMTPLSKSTRKPVSRTPAPAAPTREKLLDIAGQVFAERGYYAATIRDICKRAGANVAAVNYHFGDKLGLYTEVLGGLAHAAQLERMRTALDQKASPQEMLRNVIRARIQGLQRGNLPEWHFQIVAREFAQPTPAMSRMINQVSRPMYERLLELVGSIIGLAPDQEKTRLCVHSIMGQILLYVLAGPVLVRLWPQLKMTPEQTDRIADHIADFSLAYLQEAGSKHSQVTSAAYAAREK